MKTSQKTQRKLNKLKVALGFAIVSLCNQAVAGVNPIQVNELISYAVQTHPLISAARADQQATTEGVTAAKLGFFPTPSLSTSHNNANGITTSLIVRQPVWTGGKLTADVNRAIYDDKAATAKILEQQNTVAKNAIDIWQGYIYSLALQELYVSNLKQLDEFEAMMKRRVAQGASAKIELELITNRILQDQNALQGAIEQQKIAEARLEQLIGQPIERIESGLSLAKMTQEVKKNAANFGQLAFGDISRTHPIVIRQQYEIEAARQDVKAQKANYYPKLYVQYENNYHHRTRDHSDDVMVGVSYDPGAGFSNLALSRASESRVQSLTQSQEAARRTVMENIQTQYQQFISAKDQELSLTAAVGGAQIVLNSYRRQFIAGRKSWLEVLNAVREQSQYEQQLRQVQAQMIASFYKLQVDFGLMPWQQGYKLDVNRHAEFSPFKELSTIVAKTNEILAVSNSAVPNENDEDDISQDSIMHQHHHLAKNQVKFRSEEASIRQDGTMISMPYNMNDNQPKTNGKSQLQSVDEVQEEVLIDEVQSHPNDIKLSQ
ncbi:TolC family protein [Moraxella nasovis]|uniref:TolC family protein n=1 Tax=Moraxella nasovis TaxID=2904121 RepID=UPI001F601C8E|nr:TolC family protein [Moraxella nasovis]UNU73749.1 TolC family protein [Moraxella nasovis]